MKRKGINYDVGTDFMGFMTRSGFDTENIRREFEIIKNDLHCNAVRISGTEPYRLITAAEQALKQGLEVWLSPIIHDRNATETTEFIVECATFAEKLRRKWQNLVFVLGCELTIFMQGILTGDNVMERLGNPATRKKIKMGGHNPPLNAFLTQLNKAVRTVFAGSVTYASAPMEEIDWRMFDFVCVDYYRERRNRDTYAERLLKYFSHNKPVVVSEVGCCTFQGAENEGGNGVWAIFDPTRPDQLKGEYVRDEDLQAKELTELLTIIENTGANGVFVYTFSLPGLPHSDDAIHDLDMASYGLVKCYSDRKGTSYPNMPWEPKKSFRAVADYFSNEGFPTIW